MPYLVDGHKICTKCGLDKSEDEYYKNKSSKDGHMLACKECTNGYQKSEKGKEVRKKTRKKNIDKWREYDRQYRQTEIGKLSVRKTRQKRKENGKTNELARNRRKNINHRLSNNMRLRIWKALNGINKSENTRNLLGCTINDFKKHIEEQFKNGMNWNNYGTLWNIDHYIPCNYFDLSKDINQKICFHYLNMRPMYNEDNIRKHDNIPHDIENRIKEITQKI